MSKQTRGTVDSCACPWCGNPNDFRGLEDYGVEAGNVITCDHCKRNMKIERVRPVTMIWLSRYTGRGNLNQ
jgi:hypothetical protein